MTFELPNGLPEGPWTIVEFDDEHAFIEAAVGEFIANTSTGDYKAKAHAIASIPDMVEEIGRLEDLLNRQTARTEEEAELYGNALNDVESLRALNAELLEACKAVVATSHGAGHEHWTACEQARDAIAKVEGRP